MRSGLKARMLFLSRIASIKSMKDSFLGSSWFGVIACLPVGKGITPYII
jgi:hypothetical protein